MALKNTYTEMPLSRSLEKIQKILVEHGATKIMIDYSDKLPYQINFMIEASGKQIPIRLPARPDKVFAYMKKQRARSNPDLEMAYKVAWRNILDWIDAQMAIIEIEQAELFEVFMPYLAMKDGGTLYDTHRDRILNLE